MAQLATTQGKAPRQKATSSTQVRGGFFQRKCACGGAARLSGECEECRKNNRLGLQANLRINGPRDSYKHRVDRIADQEPTSGAGRLDAAPLRWDMDQRFSHDFSRVPVHAESMSPLALLGQARNALMGSFGEAAGRVAIEIASTETKGAEGVTVGRRVRIRFRPLFESFIAEARTTVAKTLRVTIEAVGNEKIFRNVAEIQEWIQSLGGTVKIPDPRTGEITIPL